MKKSIVILLIITIKRVLTIKQLLSIQTIPLSIYDILQGFGDYRGD